MNTEILEFPEIKTTLIRMEAVTEGEDGRLRHTAETLECSSSVVPVYSPENKTLTIVLKYEDRTTEAPSPSQEGNTEHETNQS